MSWVQGRVLEVPDSISITGYTNTKLSLIDQKAIQNHVRRRPLSRDDGREREKRRVREDELDKSTRSLFSPTVF